MMRVGLLDRGPWPILGATLLSALIPGIWSVDDGAWAEESGEIPSAASLMQGVYDASAWIGEVDSFLIRARQTAMQSEEAWQWRQENPIPVPGLMQEKPRPYEARPYVIEETYAWDRHRIHVSSHSYRQGEAETDSHHSTRIWDGKLGVDWSADNDGPAKQAVIADQLTRMFTGEQFSNMWMRPWGCGGAYGMWWCEDQPVEVYRKMWGIQPADFEYLGREELAGYECHVVESPVGYYRMHIGVADGRLYQRCWSVRSKEQKPVDELAIAEEICGREFKSYLHFTVWCDKQPSDEARRIHRAMKRRLYEHVVMVRKQRLDDYREVASGCWLPFHQVSESYSAHSPKSFVESRNEYTVTEVEVNEALDDALFRDGLVDGTIVSTDWRYEPSISYTYRKDQPESERVALAEKRRQQLAEGQAVLDKAKEKLVSRRGQTPPPLPQTGWYFGEPKSWEELRGKVVVLTFWETHCGPCKNELPLVAKWNDASEGDVVFIGIHPPTEDVEVAMRVLIDAKAEFPTIIEPMGKEGGPNGELHEWFGNSWYPNSVLIDKQGAVAGFGNFMGVHRGLSQQIRELLVAEE
jgi:thiol-disulfide isomerase/thioredoxin